MKRKKIILREKKMTETEGGGGKEGLCSDVKIEELSVMRLSSQPW